MKTFAHIKNGDVVNILLAYNPDGSYVKRLRPYIEELGIDAGLLAFGDAIKPKINTGTELEPNWIIDPDVTTVVIDTSELSNSNGFTYDKTFRNAFKHNGLRVITDIPKAKLIAHEKRRAKRAAELQPLDVEATIPAKANQAEAARQAIRDKHATLQTAIDSATTEAALKQLLVDAGAL